MAGKKTEPKVVPVKKYEKDDGTKVPKHVRGKPTKK